MSEVDRRPLVVNEDGEILGSYLAIGFLHEEGRYYHESAVRELVEQLAVVYEHWMGGTMTQVRTAMAETGDLLTHYAELVDNTEGGV